MLISKASPEYFFFVRTYSFWGDVILITDFVITLWLLRDLIVRNFVSEQLFQNKQITNYSST